MVFTPTGDLRDGEAGGSKSGWHEEFIGPEEQEAVRKQES